MKFAILFVFALASAPATAVDTDRDAQARFKTLYETEWAFRLQEFPEFASYVGVHDYDGRLDHVAEPDQKRRQLYWQDTLNQLNNIHCETLGREECINYRIFKRQLQGFIANVEHRYYLMPFNSDSGFYTNWTRLPVETEFDNTTDYENYLARLTMLPEIMDEYIELMREGIEIGMTQPRVVLDGRDVAIRSQVVDKPENSAFYEPFKTRQCCNEE